MTTVQEQAPMALLDNLSQYANALDTFATWLAGKAAEWGDLPEPYLEVVDHDDKDPQTLKVNVICLSADELAHAASLMAAGAPIGSVRKHHDDTYMRVTRSFGLVELEAWAMRARVCERVQVGVETVEVPDPDAPKVTVERPVYEWECKPLLAAVQS